MKHIKRSEEYETIHEDIGCVRLNTNKKWDGAVLSYSTRRVEPVPNSRKVDYVRDLIILSAKRGTLMDLPYSITGLYDRVYANDDTTYWYQALEGIRLRGDKERLSAFIAEITELDLRIYDEARADEIKARYTRAQLPVSTKETLRENQGVIDVEEAEFMEDA